MSIWHRGGEGVRSVSLISSRPHLYPERGKSVLQMRLLMLLAETGPFRSCIFGSKCWEKRKSGSFIWLEKHLVFYVQRWKGSALKNKVLMTFPYEPRNIKYHYGPKWLRIQTKSIFSIFIAALYLLFGWRVQNFQTLKKDLNYISSAMFPFCEKLRLLIGGFKAPKPTPKTALDFFSLLWSNSAIKINTIHILDLFVFCFSLR